MKKGKDRKDRKRKGKKIEEAVNFILFCTQTEINRRMIIMCLWVPILILPVRRPSTTAASCTGLRSTASPSFSLCTNSLHSCTDRKSHRTSKTTRSGKWYEFFNPSVMPITSPPKKSVNFNIEEEEMYPLIEMLEVENTLRCIETHSITMSPYHTMIQRIIIHFQGRADYSKIARCVQNADEGVLI